jgi:hypothetical protein
MNAKRIVSSVIPFLLVAVLAMMMPTAVGADEGSTPKVGVFNTRGVALAYGRSEEGLQRFAILHEQHRAAEAAGDTAKVRELKTQGSWLQERMHMQVFGNLPIDDILEGREAMLAEVAREAGVVMIVSNVAYRLGYVDIIDVTRNIAMKFGADAGTLTMIEDLHTQEHVALPFDFSGE